MGMQVFYRVFCGYSIEGVMGKEQGSCEDKQVKGLLSRGPERWFLWILQSKLQSIDHSPIVIATCKYYQVVPNLILDTNPHSPKNNKEQQRPGL